MLVLGFAVIVLVVRYIPVKYLSIFSPLILGLGVLLLAVALVLRVGEEQEEHLIWDSFLFSLLKL
jgi:cell division protein FtsW (lipid II flippase)